MYKSSLRQIHDPVLLSLKVEVICFVLSCFPPSLPLFRIPRPHTCIGSESRLSLREGSTAQAAMTSLCYDSCEFHWNKRRLRHIHVKKHFHSKRSTLLRPTLHDDWRLQTALPSDVSPRHLQRCGHWGFFSGVSDTSMCPGVDSASKKMSTRILLGVNTAGA